jgi:hypothetical protein
MSFVRKHFWIDIRRFCGGCDRPMKYGFICSMPAVVNSSVYSSGGGISDEEGTRRCPRSSKKRVKSKRISDEFIVATD